MKLNYRNFSIEVTTDGRPHRYDVWVKRKGAANAERFVLQSPDMAPDAAIEMAIVAIDMGIFNEEVERV